MLGDALTLPETPIPLKVARLFLLSDILHNSTAPVRNASRYRAKLEDLLPDVFESLAEATRLAESRMAQEMLRRHVLKVLRIWRGWFIFNDDFLNGLQATFLRPPPAAAAPANAELAAELAVQRDEDLETRCRRSGLSRKGGRAAQVSRLLALDAYLNGDSTRQLAAVEATPAAAAAANPTSSWEAVAEPEAPRSKWEQAVEEDPMRAAAVVAPSAEPLKPPAQPAAAAPAARAAPKPAVPLSKWEQADLDARPAEPSRAAPLADLEWQQPQPQPPAAAPEQGTPGGGSGETAASAATKQVVGEAADEERRRLREVEVAVMQYKEELEEKGMKREEVERRAAEHRQRLLAEAERPLEPRAGSRSSSKSAHRDRDRDRERDRDRDRGRENERDRERDRDREGTRADRRDRKRSRSRSRSPRRDSRGDGRSRSRKL